MNPELQQYEKHWKVTRIIVFMLNLLFPLVFLVVAYVINVEPQPAGGLQILFYGLLGLAILQPLAALPIERIQIDNYRKTVPKKMNPAQLYSSLAIIKASLVEAIFLFGLVVVLLTADKTYLIYFYAVGAIWAAVYWPTEEKFEAFIRKVQTGVERT